MKPLLALLFNFLLSATIFAQTKNGGLQITKLTENSYIYITSHVYKNSIATANGLYVVTNQGVILIDTPWDTTRFQPLLDSIWARHHQPVVLCIATHSHEDRTAGLEYYRQKNIKTYTSTKTDSISIIQNQKRAQFHFTKDTTFTIGQTTLQIYYPGPGHTADNIVIWFNQQKILYGGCFIKNVEAEDLGYIKEANLQAWPASLKKVQQKFPQPKYIIPGHDDFASLNAINHTLKLLQKNEAENIAKAKTFKLTDTIVKVGQTYTTHQIYFGVSKPDILEQSRIIVDSMVTFLNANPGVKLEIQNHCDSRGAPGLNNHLTIARAQAVVDYLVAKGINKDRLMAKGFGENNLLITDAQINQAKTKDEKEALHAINRRVVLKILSTK